MGSDERRPVAQPLVVIVAGPNGAGKSTSAADLLKGALAVPEFVNADTIAAGLSAFQPDTVATAAGRLMLARMQQLAAARQDFAFETTLASRSFAPWIGRLRGEGYHSELLFLWLKDPELAVRRVAERVRRGGHAVPADVVRRRYEAGLRNFFTLYRPLLDGWRLFDNSGIGPPRLIAEGHGDEVRVRADAQAWQQLVERYGG